VVPAKHLYHCFVCGESGDVFKFLQKRLGVEWPEAVKMVGEKTGIEVVDTRVRREGPDPREPMWELQATAASYFQKMLWDDPVGEPAREYLEKRELPRAIADEFGLGFSPREIGLLRSYMNALGFDDARLIDAGLLIASDQDGEPRPRFRNRLMFPILDVMGRNVGFGGRILGPGEPKYLNSSDSPIFSKGKLLYGLHRSRNAIRKADRSLVVEGYFDALRLISAGIEEVVAPLGTALTETQAGMLRKYSRNVYLLYDSDAAGLKATFRAGDELLRQGMSVRVITLPPGEDPDTFVRKHGGAGLEAQVTASIDVFERKIQILERAGWFGELQKKRRALDRLLPTIRATSDEIMRDLYVARASEVTGVDRGILLRELGPQASTAPAAAPRRAEPPRPAIRGRSGDRREPRRNAGTSAERELVRAMVQDRSRVEPIAERIGPEALAAVLEPVAIVLMQEMLGEDGALVNVQRTIDDSITRLHVRDMEERVAEIDRLLPIANEVEKDALQEERAKLVVQMRASGRMTYKAFRPGRTR
jgi:DNA primase